MKKKIYIIIAVIILGLATVGATYAFFTARVSANNLNSSSMDFKVVYTGGTTIDGSLELLKTRDGASNTTVHIRMDEGSTLAKANLYINIDEISSELATSGFLWEVEGKKNNTVVYTNSGNFNGKATNDKLYIVEEYQLDYVNTDFTVYLWLDFDTVGNEVIGKTFRGYIGAETEYFTGKAS